MRSLLNLLLVLCLFNSKSLQTFIEIPFETPTESNVGGETTPALLLNPEETNIRAESPTEATLVTPADDVTLPQDLLDATDSTLSNTNKFKRCSRHNILVGDQPDVVTLSLTRRDVKLDKQKQQCEICRNSRICKVRKICNGCKVFCDSLDQIDSTSKEVAEVISNNLDNNIPLESSNVIETENPNSIPQILESRFGGEEQLNNEPQFRYYSLGATNQKSAVNLLARVFNIANKTNYEKFIVLGQKKSLQNDGTFILDSAQVFSSSSAPQILRLSDRLGLDDNSVQSNIAKSIQDALESKRKILKTKQLSIPQINQVLDETLAQLSNPTLQEPETQTRCDLMEDAANELLNIASRNHESKSPEVEEKKQESESTIHNPAVIQDNLNVVGKEAEEISDNVEDLNNIIGEEQKPVSEKKLEAPIQSTKPRTHYDSSEEGSSSSSSMSDSNSKEEYHLVGENNPEERKNLKNNLENNIIELVEDSLKAASNENLLEPHLEEQSPQNAPSEPITGQENPRPSPVNIDNVMEELRRIPQIVSNVADDVQKETDNIRNLQGDPNLRQNLQDSVEDKFSSESMESNQAPDAMIQPPEPIEPQPTMVIPESPPVMPESDNQVIVPSQEPNVQQLESNNIPPPNVESRFPDEIPVDQPHVGSLVPSPEVSQLRSNAEGNNKSNIRNYYFVGKDINLPLQMVEDENGIVRLTVDMDKLCHCKSKNCTRKHADNNEEQEVAATIPLAEKTRFGRESSDNLLVEPLHMQSEGSEIFKRSPLPYQDLQDISDNNLGQEEYDEVSKIVKEYEFAQMEKEIESDLEKLEQLNSNVQKSNNHKNYLINKGTVALLRNGEKTERNDRMLNLASNLLTWMKDLSASSKAASLA